MAARSNHVCHLLTIALCLGFHLIGQDQDPILDVTKMQPPPDESSPGVEVHVTNSWAPPVGPLKAVPLDVSVLGIEQDSVDNGRQIIATVRVRNTTSAPVEIPWTIDHRLKKVDPDAALLVLYLALRTDVGKDYSTDSVGLYGTKKVDASMMVLAPGQSVRIRASFRTLETPFDDLGTPNLRVGVRALVGFLTGPWHNLEHAKSKDAVRIMLHDPRR